MSAPTRTPDRGFEVEMTIARCRWLLTLEARGISTRLLADNSFSAPALHHQLLLAVANAKPRSRLVPWYLTDRIVERIIVAVVADVGETWTT
jgi:hypothetical protein